jgi:hypothetical protein
MKAIRKLPAIFYCSANGHEPVREWLKSMNQLDRKIIGEDIAYVQYKWPIGKPRVDYLRESIWEVRSQNTANTTIRTGVSHQAMEGMET